MEKYPVLFVGAGPGDPELITVKGQKALQAADLVIYAGSLVPKPCCSGPNPDVNT
ncbi:precorrin-4 C(11)-methyltransferase [Desulfonema ishimotonii]|uniref:Precorrin-4 C(11)-methyltransferase n=1 Tax=Desulfonema ishimotonii TaxID=45657 RepID=A0A401FTU8_9BACT|nr:precorrin-4 C(11)-methyltransferase [Desulfonema ishimotonii]